MVSGDDRQALDELDFRLKILLPQQYQESYEALQPVPMRAAGLKFSPDGRVAWDEIWQSFCDLAMAGGPPHKGVFLRHGSRAEVAAQPVRYEEVAEEICRGVVMATDLPAKISSLPGWVRIDCLSEVMASWLLRAITMENVAVGVEGRALVLPAAPGFRLEKEIKNVVTVIAKTTHYWLGHMSREQKQAIAELFATLHDVVPLVEPALPDDDGRPESHHRVAARIAAAIRRETGLIASNHVYAGWLGLRCPSVRAAVWMMRGLVACNVLARREETLLFVPINPSRTFGEDAVVRRLAHVHRLASISGVLAVT